jgi:2-iminobutanoate/2-iminopropanoate deaminase
MKQQITTGDTKSAHILSQAIVSNGFIFLSGQVHCNSELELVGDTTEEKLVQIMKNIETILKAAGADMNDIVKVVIYVTDMSIMPDLNKVYTSYFSDPLPVREAVCVKALPLGSSIEVSVVAEKRQSE